MVFLCSGVFRLAIVNFPFRLAYTIIIFKPIKFNKFNQYKLKFAFEQTKDAEGEESANILSRQAITFFDFPHLRLRQLIHYLREWPSIQT